MKKLFVLLALFLLSVPFIAAQEEDCLTRQDLASEVLGSRYMFLHFRAEHRRISMDAVIDKFDENSIDSSELKAIKDDFVALYDTAKSAADSGDKTAFEDAIMEGKDLIADFKEKTKAQNTTGLKLREAIKTALDENKDYLKGLHNDAVNSKIELYLKIFDARACHHQNVIDRLSGKGVDTAELQSDLDAIDAKKDDLSAKIDAAEAACEVPIVACTTPEATAVKDLHKEINDDFMALNEKIKETIKSELEERAAAIRDRLARRNATTTEAAETTTETAEGGESQ